LPLRAWETFFFLVGSSGAALTGLQFVVIALIAESRRRATPQEIAAFGTPTIVHFVAVLIVSAILSAPWQDLTSIGLALGLCGLSGLIYTFIVIKRARRQTSYRPVLEDWLWHVAFPILSYASLLVSGIFIRSAATQVLFVTGGAVLLLLLTGIHNSWDTVTYITVDQSHGPSDHKHKTERKKSH
jgi:hypothetical protein